MEYIYVLYSEILICFIVIAVSVYLLKRSGKSKGYLITFTTVLVIGLGILLYLEVAEKRANEDLQKATEQLQNESEKYTEEVQKLQEENRKLKEQIKEEKQSENLDR
ncbi:MAG TPA: hypothetical protein VLB82_07025 [Thermodesulfobacteriota bacterium]|nr:hypothetical protein [Thermodesulfobacteriota bacterium]